MSADSTLDALGLGGALPCPGWVVLDAARDHRFTGELVADADGTFRVYFDRGRIYVAERATDPPLGARLVDAGALNAAQLDYGTLRIGDIQHLGRLFERVPSVNRDGVLVLNQLMTEECVRSLAARAVSSLTATPYRHHVSGMHRWEAQEPAGGASATGEVPEMELPAPPPDSRPIIADEPPAEPRRDLADHAQAGEGLTADGATEPDVTTRADRFVGSAATRDLAGDLFLDDLVQWDEPSVLGAATRTPGTPTARRTPRDLFADTPSGSDWAEDLGPDGVGDAPGEPSPASARLTPLAVRPVDQFELIWPSGETADLADSAPPADDLDRRGPTARLAPSVDTRPEQRTPSSGQPDESTDDDPAIRDVLPSDAPPPEDTGEPSTLAVRRAVATIDTGSLAARRRLAAAPTDTPPPPGRLMVGREHSSWRTTGDQSTTSVFDELPVPSNEPVIDEPRTETTPHQGRTSALRRLIDSLRRD